MPDISSDQAPGMALYEIVQKGLRETGSSRISSLQYYYITAGNVDNVLGIYYY